MMFALAICLCVGASVAFGQAGMIGLYADPSGSVCTIEDTGPGPMNIYAVHTGTTGALGSSFSAPVPSCMTGATWLADVHQFSVTLSNSQDGVSMGYGACLEGPIHVLTMSLWVTGQSTVCCPFRVLPTPGVRTGRVEGVSCDLVMNFPDSGVLIVNGNGACSCAALTAATQEKTWGAMKSLYSEAP